MSRIGLKPIEVPAGVEINYNDGLVEVKGPKGSLTQKIGRDFKVNMEDGTLNLERPSEDKEVKALHGLYRTLIDNMLIGVTEGYSKTLKIEGTGYRASKQGKNLVMNLGFSHQVTMEDPEGIETEVNGDRTIIVKGVNKQLVGEHAANIRNWRKPEPYKGKGIRYVDEYVRRKVGKTGK